MYFNNRYKYKINDKKKIKNLSNKKLYKLRNKIIKNQIAVN